MTFCSATATGVSIATSLLHSEEECNADAIRRGDFDDDDHLDLAVGSRYLYAADNRVLIFRGNGDGTMLPPSQYDVGWQPAIGAMAERRVFQAICFTRAMADLFRLCSGGAASYRAVIEPTPGKATFDGLAPMGISGTDVIQEFRS